MLVAEYVGASAGASRGLQRDGFRTPRSRGISCRWRSEKREETQASKDSSCATWYLLALCILSISSAATEAVSLNTCRLFIYPSIYHALSVCLVLCATDFASSVLGMLIPSLLPGRHANKHSEHTGYNNSVDWAKARASKWKFTETGDSHSLTIYCSGAQDSGVQFSSAPDRQ